MERYNQRRFDCRRSTAMPASCGHNMSRTASDSSCGCNIPRTASDSCGCNMPRTASDSCDCAAARDAARERKFCRLIPDTDSNVCRPGECVSSQNAKVAMGYVPWQEWECTYPLDKALFIGTVFPSLDKPFEIGRCAIRP